MEGSKAILQALQDFKKQVNIMSETKSLNHKAIKEDSGVDVVLPKVLQARAFLIEYLQGQGLVKILTWLCCKLLFTLVSNDSRHSLDRCSPPKERQNAG